HPSDLDAWNDLSVAHMADGLWEAACGSLDRVLGVFPEHRQGLLNRAEAGLQVRGGGRPARRLVALDPHLGPAVAALADTASKGDPASAARWYRAALAIDHASPRLWAN